VEGENMQKKIEEWKKVPCAHCGRILLSTRAHGALCPPCAVQSMQAKS
jgi:hypothetical protein